MNNEWTRLEIPFQLLKRVSERIQECWCGAALWMTPGLCHSGFPVNPNVRDSLQEIREAAWLCPQPCPHFLQMCWNLSVSCCFPSYHLLSISFSSLPTNSISSHFFRRWEVSPSQRKASNCDVISKHHHILSTITSVQTLATHHSCL